MVFEDIKVISIFTRMLHLGTQIAAGYWAVKIDGSSCAEGAVATISYLGYALLIVNLIVLLLINKGNHINEVARALVLLLDVVLAVAVLYLAAQGYNSYNNCVPNRVLYTFFLVVSAVGIVLSLLIMFAKFTFAQMYSNWPANIAWPILLLATEFSGDYKTPAFIIGVVTALICFTSFFLNLLYTVSSNDFISKSHSIQWTVAIVLLCILEIYAFLTLITAHGSDLQARKSLVVFTAVNIVDLMFWLAAKNKFGGLAGL